LGVGVGGTGVAVGSGVAVAVGAGVAVGSVVGAGACVVWVGAVMTGAPEEVSGRLASVCGA
jgi:hypothetical protein